MSQEPMAELIKRWNEARAKGEYLDRLEGFAIADYACRVLPILKSQLVSTAMQIEEWVEFQTVPLNLAAEIIKDIKFALDELEAK